MEYLGVVLFLLNKVYLFINVAGITTATVYGEDLSSHLAGTAMSL